MRHIFNNLYLKHEKMEKNLLFQKLSLPLYSGCESVNPAKFSEAEQSLVKQGFINNLNFTIK